MLNNGYKKILKKINNKYFLSPSGSNLEHFSKLVIFALKKVVDSQGDGPVYKAKNKSSIFNVIKKARIPQKAITDPFRILGKLPLYMSGCVKPSNPYMVKNILPLPSFLYLSVYNAISLYMPNAVTGEDAAAVLDAEIACVAALSKLACISPDRSAGLFTFGGTGTNFYAIKIGLSKALPAHRNDGVKDDAVIMDSRAAHYSHLTSLNWLGMGEKNQVIVKSNIDQTMNVVDFEMKVKAVLEEGKKIACIVCSGGTTSNMAIDDIYKIYKIRNKLVKKYNLDYVPHIHCDSVVGWVYLNFVKYDFNKNKLKFSSSVLQKLEGIVEKISKIKYADSFGVDFHKTGYVPYISSLVIFKNRNNLNYIQHDKKNTTPLFHNSEVYNPGKFTLETSRSGSNILATWLSVQSIGVEGFQSIIGHALEMSKLIRDEIIKNEQYGLYIANQKSFGNDVLVRCYKSGLNSEEMFMSEISDDKILKNNNEYFSKFAKWLLENDAEKEDGIALSRSSAAFYSHTGAPVPALRIYSLNPYFNGDDAKILVKRLVGFKKQFDKINRHRQER
ncbi:MAG: pyridoxal-dependent decarboxylase [Candidatus Absconditabacterales bacterium]|jgi:glutamate/tyrosine decarboxylase-like PLP-dependent enzyme